VLSAEALLVLQGAADDVFVHHAVADYAVRLVMASRDPARWGIPDLAPLVALGASPRATLGLLAAGRALALLRGRRFLVPQDVYDVAPEVLRHRLLLSYDALAGGVQVDQVIARLLAATAAPRVAPHQDAGAAPPAAPTTVYPSQPWTATPTQPWPATAEQPSAATTEEPSAATAAQPWAATAEQPSAATAAQPWTATPEQPSAATAAQPWTATPEQPPAATAAQPAAEPTSTAVPAQPWPASPPMDATA
jgi:MoxR-like ATPase